jgi:hypothetical protein
MKSSEARNLSGLVFSGLWPLFWSQRALCVFSSPSLHTQEPRLVIAILETMTALSHLLTLAVLAILLRWHWNSSTAEQAKFAAGRQLFPPTRA